MSDEQGELERVAALLERRAKESDQMATVASEANDPVTEAHCEGMSMAYDIAMKYLRRMVARPAPSAAAADQPSPTEYNAETLATMLDQVRAENAKLQGELERVRPVVEAIKALSDVYDPGRNSPVPFAAARTLAERELLRKYDAYLSTAPSAPAEQCRRRRGAHQCDLRVGHGGAHRSVSRAGHVVDWLDDREDVTSDRAEQSAPVSKSQAKRIAIQSESAPGGTACPECGGTGEVIDDPLEHEASTKLVYVPCPSCSTGRDEAGKL